jgi:hypothetical protein
VRLSLVETLELVQHKRSFELEKVHVTGLKMVKGLDEKLKSERVNVNK